jgi:hypothetical protein
MFLLEFLLAGRREVILRLPKEVPWKVGKVSLETPVFVLLALCDIRKGAHTSYESGSQVRLGEPGLDIYNRPKSGSWHSTHGRVWLIGTRAQPDSLARPLRVLWAPLTLSVLMSYIYGSPFKARNFYVVYIWTYVWQRWKLSLSVCWTMFQHWINAESFPVSQLCVNTLSATKVTLFTDWVGSHL